MSDFNVQEVGGQQEMVIRNVTHDQVMAMLQKKTGRFISRRPMLGVRQLRMAREANDGYPHDMHHPTLRMVTVENEDQEQEMLQHGYINDYNALPADCPTKCWPKAMYRRNMAEKFGPPDPNKPIPAYYNGDYIEMVVLRDQFHMNQVLYVCDDAGKPRMFDGKPKLKPRKQGEGPWVDRVTEIEPLPDEVDPAQSLAEATGEKRALQAQIDKLTEQVSMLLAELGEKRAKQK